MNLKFILAAKEPLKYQGINRIGLKRRGFDQKSRNEIKKIYQLIFSDKMNISQAIKLIKRNIKASNYKNDILNFIQKSSRGII